MSESEKSKYVRLAVCDKRRFEEETERIEVLKKSPKKRDLKSSYKHTPHEHVSTKSENYSIRAQEEEEQEKKLLKDVNSQCRSKIRSWFFKKSWFLDFSRLHKSMNQW